MNFFEQLFLLIDFLIHFLPLLFIFVVFILYKETFLQKHLWESD